MLLFIKEMRLPLSKSIMERDFAYSQVTSVSVNEYKDYRQKFCELYHQTDTACSCKILICASQIMADKKLTELSSLFKGTYSSLNLNAAYKSDKAFRLMIQLPISIFKADGILYVTELRAEDEVERCKWLIEKFMKKQMHAGLGGKDMKSLCALASTEKDRKLIKYSIMQERILTGRNVGMSKIGQLKAQVQDALRTYENICRTINFLSTCEEEAILRSFGLCTETNEETCSLSEEEQQGYKYAELSNSESKYPDFENFQDIIGNNSDMVDVEDSCSIIDSDSEDDQHIFDIKNVDDQEIIKIAEKKRSALRRRRERDIAKEVAKAALLKRRIPEKVCQVLKRHPQVGRDIEDFVVSKNVGADSWRRTGVLTFDGNIKQGRKVTFQMIKDHLEEKYDEKISYGTVVQLCVAKNKRNLSAKRYKGIAQVTSRRARKGFNIKLNPDTHWSNAFYRGLDWVQLKDGTDKVLLNRDDQAGFRLDTTFTHKQGKTISLVNKPTLTTRTDYVNQYPSVLQTTSYYFMESENTSQKCIGIVKPHYTFQKSASQHAADLAMLQGTEEAKSHLSNRHIDCIRVDGGGDEGPSHLEVQFRWTERHIQLAKSITIVTARYSGGSYLNKVELMNGGLAKAHANLFIPSTLAGKNITDQGLDLQKLAENLEVATDVYIDRVNGASCCSTTVHLLKGARGENADQYISTRQDLLVFLRGKKKDKEKLQETKPDLHKYFENVWAVRTNHMDERMPINYCFLLDVMLCKLGTSCVHPLCSTQKKDHKWFKDGPVTRYIPLPIADLNKPGHYLEPEKNYDEWIENGDANFCSKPPSSLIKEAVMAGPVTEEKLQFLQSKTLLPSQELKMYIENALDITERRKNGARKAAATRSKKSAELLDTDERHTIEGSQIRTGWCWCNTEECSDMIRCCNFPKCPTEWFHLHCLGMTHYPPSEWYCRDCQSEDDLRCVCMQPEFGLMIGCSSEGCTGDWYHLSCMGMMQPPKGTWYCPKCAGNAISDKKKKGLRKKQNSQKKLQAK